MRPRRLIATCGAPTRLSGRRLQQIGRQTHLTLRAEFAGLKTRGANHLRHCRRSRQLILRAHLAQGAVQCTVEEIMHHTAVAEAHLMLGRMHIHIHHRRIDLKEQHEGRMATVVQHIAVRLAHRMGDQLVADHAPVDVEILQVRLTAGEGGQADPAPQVQAVALDLDGQSLFKERRATNRRHPARPRLGVMRLMQRQHRLAVVTQMKRHIETRQRQLLDHILQVIELGLLGAQELAPRRGIEEQVTHFHRGTDRMRRWLHAGLHVTAFGFHLPGLAGLRRARSQRQSRHRTDGGQRLTTKPQTVNGFQILQITNLAGGVTSERQRQVIGGNTTAIVTHAQQLDATLLDIHVDAGSTGIQAVFQEFLGNRSRPLDHFAGGNLVGQPRAEQLDTTQFGHG